MSEVMREIIETRNAWKRLASKFMDAPGWDDDAIARVCRLPVGEVARVRLEFLGAGAGQ